MLRHFTNTSETKQEAYKIMQDKRRMQKKYWKIKADKIIHQKLVSNGVFLALL